MFAGDLGHQFGEVEHRARGPLALWGIVLVLGGLALWSGAAWARWLAVALAAVNIYGQLGWLGSSAYPLWTLVIISLNVIVIYALTARWEGFPERA